MSLHERILTETLTRKKKVRHGWVYVQRTPTGPPPPTNPSEEALDDLIRDVALNFDFSPIFSGDQRFAKRVAEDFVKELRAAVEGSSMKEEDMDERLSKLWPWWYRGLRVFRHRLNRFIAK